MRGGGVAEIRKLPVIANGNSFVVVLLIPIDEAVSCCVIVRFDVVIIFALNVLNEGNRIELNIKVETCW
jgi:hypothetical protein